MENKVIKVVKRNGEVVSFDEIKIRNAIRKAHIAVYPFSNAQNLLLKVQVLSNKVIERLNELSFEKKFPTVEEIQDLVEDVLLDSDRKVYKAFAVYRSKHAEKRQEKEVVGGVQRIFDQYIGLKDWKTKENSNMAYSLQGLNQYIVAELTEEYWLNKIYPQTIRESHKSGDFHLHDLSLFAPYCCGWSLEDLLREGFCGVEGKTESAPPKHFKPALGQIVNFLYTLQGEAAGAQAFSNFDTLLAPFIKEDNLTYKEVKQAMQEFIFNCNVPTRVGFQTPFINLTMDLTVPENYKNNPILIGGKLLLDKVYGDYQKEMNMLNQAFAEVMLEGDKLGRQFSFPLPTYNLTQNFDWDNPVLDIVFEMTAKYGIPSFCNYINSELSPEDATSMCCRLRLDRRELKKRGGGGLFGSAPLTGSTGVVTINMPRLGYVSKNEEDFFARLRYLMDLAKESLMIKRKILEHNTEIGLYPYAKFYLKNTYARHGSYWANHFSTIGLNGMNECLMNFFGKETTMATKEGIAFTTKVLDYMRDVLQEYQEEEGNVMFNLEATPAEGTAYKLALKDKKIYPNIISQGTDEPYYTNSTQLPVNLTDDLFDALDLQEELQTKYTGGTTFHGYLGQRIEKDTCKALVRKIAENYRIPYFTISPTYSVCPEHGYIKGENFTCPICGKESEVWARVVGFNRPVKQWNKGKREEFKDRVTFDIAK
ncbi:MAG: anaerobic ribonucleoside-triphosphate reductase [Clostridiaceae bacterium]|jgi:ribonucleoside-triphosphate reductase|nr:anaerobic ribonucleoside-triphosphate reductase [Clostridiaceae bacterium]